MLVVITKSQLVKLIRLTRDDRGPQRQWKHAPFLRLEARQGEQVLRVTGRAVEGTLPATVHIPGVMFLRVTVFRTLLAMTLGGRGGKTGGFIAMHAGAHGLSFEDVTIRPDDADILVYPIVETAPALHPSERQIVGPPIRNTDSDIPFNGSLFAQ